MTAVEVLSIAVSAVALLVLVFRGGPRWTRRPWLLRQPPSRRMLALVVAVLLVIAVIHAFG
jgi:hypothetical protein